MMRAFKEWLDTRENNLAATVVSPRDAAFNAGDRAGTERLMGLPKENRPPHLLYAHSDKDVGNLQKELITLQQQVRTTLDKIKQTETYNDPAFRQKQGQLLKYMTAAHDGLGGASTLLTFDQAGARKAVADEEENISRRRGY